MKNAVYYKDTDISNITFPDAAKRRISQGVRNITVIPDYRAIVDRNNERVFAIVKDGYHVARHENVIEKLDDLCHEFKEYGEPTREIWMSNYGGRMKTRWTFKELDFEIGTLSDGTPDTVHPTLETFCSYDTSLAHTTMVGGFRTICSNGLIIGKILGRYKRKHTIGLDLERARMVLAQGMTEYSEAQNLWVSYMQREALMDEVNCYEDLGFNLVEKLSIENEIKRQGKVIEWDDEDKEKRNVEINAWQLYNIYTAEASHRVSDLTRQFKISDKIATAFHA